MTRMLLNLLLAVFITTTITSCGLFEEDSDKVLLDAPKAGIDNELSDDLGEDESLEASADDGLGLDEGSAKTSESDKIAEDLGEDDEDFGEEDAEAPVSVTQPEESLDDLESDIEDADLSISKTEQSSQELLLGDDKSSNSQITESSMSEDLGKIVDLQYRAFEGSGTVVIQTNKQVEYNVREMPDTNQVIIEISNVKLPDHLKRPYITKDFYQDVAIINAYQDANSSTARFIIQYNKAINPYVTQEGKLIYVKSDGDIKMAQAQATQEELSTQSQETQAMLDQEVNKNFKPLEREGVYTGRKIHIELDEVDVKQAIHLIAEQSGANIIVDSDVQGKTSIKLRNVPWDQALSVILKSKGLGYVRQANVLRIATQANLTKEAQDLKKYLEDQKEARMASGGLRVKMVPISYSEVEELERQLKNFLSKDGKVSQDKRTSSIVITDYQEFIDRAEQVIKSLDVPPKQVLIEAKIVEARDTFFRQSGFNWSSSGKSFAMGQQNGTLGLNNGVRATAPGGLSTSLNVGVFDIFGDITASLALAEKNDEIKILSSPKVIVLNNVQSTIKQVTQVPIRRVTAVQAGVERSAEFRDLELLLQVTPQITFSGNVILKILLKRDFAGEKDEELGAVEINKREANTQILVKNGQTAVLGGVYQSDANKTEEGTPFLKDIPILGYLFKRNSREERKNELAIFIKPTILGDTFSNVMANSSSNNSSGANVKDSELEDQLGEDLEDSEEL